MHHLGTLRIVHYVMAAIHGLATLLLLGVSGLAVVFLRQAFAADPAFSQPGGPPPELIGGIVLAVLVLAALLLVVETILFVVAGRAVGQARGRILVTILAIFQIASFPVGTAFGIYALWVCWSHPPTKAAFDQAR